MSLLTELDAFYLDHRRCGELEAGVEGPVAHVELYKTLEGQPGQAGFTVAAALFVGGFDPATGGMVLFGFSSADGFIAAPDGRLLHRRASAGSDAGSGGSWGPLSRTAHGHLTVWPAPAGWALQEVAKVNPEVGPTGHVVIVRLAGSELRPF